MLLDDQTSPEILTVAYFGCRCEDCGHGFPVRVPIDLLFGTALVIRCPNCLSTDGVDLGAAVEIPAELYETYTGASASIDMAQLARLRSRMKEADTSFQLTLPGIFL